MALAHPMHPILPFVHVADLVRIYWSRWIVLENVICKEFKELLETSVGRRDLRKIDNFMCDSQNI